MDRFFRNGDLSGLEKYIAGADRTPSVKITTQTNYYAPTRFPRITYKSSSDSDSFTLPKPSKEQKKICTTVQKGHNVAIDSVFGSGKTTSILHICQQSVGKKVLVLTYNSKLKLETRAKVQRLGLTNVSVHSYHAFGVRYYRSDCLTDYEIKQLVLHDTKPKNNIQFDMVILDEQQDMTPLYYQFAQKIMADRVGTNPPQIVVFGDTYQNIYAFMGADARFLTWAPKIFTDPQRTWKNRKITTSFRTTYPIAHFINTHLLGYQRVVAQKDGGPVRYLICDSFGTTPFQEIKGYLAHGYKPEDIYILAPSLRISKNLSPVRRLENRLVKHGIPCFVPTNDAEDVNEAVTQGKVVFSTFHQVKGSERPVVLVFNIDDSYYDYYAKQESRHRCPNTVYVALSRSIERLSLVHHYENSYFPTLKRHALANDPRIEVVTTKKLTSKYKGSSEGDRAIKTPIDNLLRHLDISTIQTALEFLSYKIYRDDQPDLGIKSVVEMSGGKSEAVSDITSIAIPASYEISSTGKSSLLRWIHEESGKLSPDHHQKVGDLGAHLIRNKSLSVPDLLYLSNLYLSVLTGWTSKLQQITEYNWLDESQLTQATDRLVKLTSTNSVADQATSPNFTVEASREILGRKLLGRVDLIDNNTWYELKYTHSLESEHLLRLALVAWCNNARPGATKLVVYNIRTGERAEIQVTEKLGDLVYYLVDHKYKTVKTLTDDEFVEKITQPPATSTSTNTSTIPPDTGGCLL